MTTVKTLMTATAVAAVLAGAALVRGAAIAQGFDKRSAAPLSANAGNPSPDQLYGGRLYSMRERAWDDYTASGVIGQMTLASSRAARPAMGVIRAARVLPDGPINAADHGYYLFSHSWFLYALAAPLADGLTSMKGVKLQPLTRYQAYLELKTDAAGIVVRLDANRKYWNSLGMGLPMPYYSQEARDTLAAIAERFDPATGDFFGEEPK